MSSSMSFGDDRFDAGSSLLARRLATIEATGPENINAEDILTATSGELSHIPASHLRNPMVIGQGTSFRVTREEYHKPASGDGVGQQHHYSPYYVAVKRFWTQPGGRYNAHKKPPYAGLLRELRVIMHPPLRTHGCIVMAIAYGWDPDRGLGEQPYLVMDYSDHGNMVEYLKRCSITLEERRELAVDVASALAALHSCGIVHGDLKAENVLIYDNEDVDAQLQNFNVRSQLARISDFGSAISKEDTLSGSPVTYLGTPAYLAPELAGRPHIRAIGPSPTFEDFKSADVYSFGLLLWEIAKNGEKYVEVRSLGAGGPGRLSSQVDLDSFLNTMCALKCNALMNSAVEFCASLEETAELPGIRAAFQDTLALSLKDDPQQRGSMEDVMPVLAKGTTVLRPRYQTTSMLSHPLTAGVGLDAFKVRQSISFPTAGTGFVQHIQVKSYSETLDVRRVTDDEKPSTAARIASMPLVQPSQPSVFGHKALDIFKMLMAVQPPWSTQCQLSKKVMAVAKYSQDHDKKAHAHLQLSAMHYVGYGVEAEASQALFHLQASNSERLLPRHLYDSVSDALQDLSKHQEGVYTTEERPVNPSGRVLLPFRPEEPGLDTHTFQFRVVLPQGEDGGSQLTRLATSLHEPGDSALEGVLAALAVACRAGNFDLAKSLALQPIRLSHQRSKPNFMHWLIMFDHEKARELLDLILGHIAADAADAQECNTVTFTQFLRQDSGPPLLFPSLCLELCGTPLHWAVRTGHIGVVSLLLQHGADIDQLWQYEVRPRNDAPTEYFRPSFTALDVAVSYHFADLVTLLLDRGSKTTGQDLDWAYSCFHKIGMSVMPFSRFVAHGCQYRVALKRTIEALQQHGLDINIKDSTGETPLSLAFEAVDTDPYILSELLEAGASMAIRSNSHRDTLLISCAKIGKLRPLDARRVNMLLPRFDDLSALDDSGRSALHWCACLNVSGMARALLGSQRVLVDQRSSEGNSPLMEAAVNGSNAVIDCLSQARADLELRSSQGRTALELAVLARKTSTAVMLIRLGAQIEVEGRSILHHAVTNPKHSGSIARELLDQVPELRESRIINGSGAPGEWSPLHRAAAFGDRDGVEALLNAGADHQIGKLKPHMLETGSGTPLQLVNALITTRSGDVGLDSSGMSLNDGGGGAGLSAKEGTAKGNIERLKVISRLLSARESTGL